MNKSNKKQKRKIIISTNIAIVIILTLVVYVINSQKYVAAKNPVTYLEENKDFVLPITDIEEQVQTKKEIAKTTNSNMSIIQTKTLLDYEVKENPTQYIEDNQEEMEEGIILKVDDQELYVKDTDIIEQTKNRLMNILITDPEVEKNYELTGELTDYVKDDKKITAINLENEISYEKGLVVKSETIDNMEDLMFALFHKDNDYKKKNYYTVQENETFDQVKAELNLNDLEFYLNNSKYKDTPLLQKGDKIVTNNISPLLDIAVYYEYSVEETSNFDTIKEETDDLDVGDTEVKQQGQNGKSLVTYKAKYLNGEVVSKTKLNSKELEKIINKIILVGTYEEEDTGDAYSAGDTTASSDSNASGFIWPISSRNVTCGFGCYAGHTGTDIQGGYGASIYASKSGTVATAGWSSYGGGYEVTINHGGGVYTVYSHMKQQPNVSAGQYVSQGQVIGYEGATGNVTGPHLHFEIRLGCSSGAFSGTAVNALNYLP
ncbi:MAG: peptidoglycan DD-metalloendopeptidase family protein [Mycoplasmatales bacterium]